MLFIKEVLVVLLALAAASSGAETGDAKRIIGGEEAKIEDFPYMASLQDPCTYKHRCGATILSKLWLLTSAYCIFGTDADRLKMFPVHKFHVMVGSTKIVGIPQTELCENKNLIRYISKFVPDPKFRQPKANSIALIKLTTEISFTESPARPVKIPQEKHKKGYPEAGKICTKLGWGMTKRGEAIKEISKTLLKAELPIHGGFGCYEIYNDWPYPGGAEICTENNENISACLNDEGGPLICDGMQVGIMLWPACVFAHTKKFNAWAYVDFYLDWMAVQMGHKRPRSDSSNDTSSTEAPSKGAGGTAIPPLAATLLFIVALTTG